MIPIYMYAKCTTCGWLGVRTDLLEGGPIDELCPVCESDDTSWLTEDEYFAEQVNGQR